MILRKTTKLLIVFLALLLLTTTACSKVGIDPATDTWFERDQAGQPQIRLYFFWSTQCAHCRKALPFVDFIGQSNAWVDLQSLQLVGEKHNVRRFEVMAESLGRNAQSVPTFMFCKTMLTGFDVNKTPNQLSEGLRHCRDYLVQHPDLEDYVPLSRSLEAEGVTVDLPFIGRVSPDGNSLLFVTVAIAAVDAFNPCAFFVLMFLLSMMLHLGSRRRMLLVGGIFVLCSGVIYFLFMSAWLNLFRMIGQIEIITTIAALIAIIVGVINIKDFFWFKKGVSLSIPDKARPGLYQRTRALLQSKSLYTLIGATIVLAFFANVYELLCTAGFPMVYTRILTLNELEPTRYYMYLVLYNIIYIVPLLTIVVVFIASLGGRKLQEQEGRGLKLISGMMMLALGVVLLLVPTVLNNLFATLVIMFAAVGCALLVIMVDRRRNRLSEG